VSKFDRINSPELLADLKTGSPDAFNHLATEMFTPLWRFLVVRLRVPKSDAEDIAQETLMKVYEQIGTFKRVGNARLTSWICQIARNLAYDFYASRPEQHEEFNENEFVAPYEKPFAGLNFEYLLRLRDALETLSAQQQEILLWRSNDIPYSKIARWHDVKESTSRVQHLRAMKRLRAAVQVEETTENEDAPTDQDLEVVCTTSN
jgi:RNA polymerase sigma factor (sigma-70 family)